MTGQRPLGNRPVTVLTADLRTAPSSTSSRGEQRVIPHSGHLMHLRALEAVIQAVIDVVDEIR